MNRYVLSGFLAVAVVARADQPAMGQLDASPTLFTVMAAINAAGYDGGLAHSHPLRLAIREELAKKDIPSLKAIREFVARHRQSNEEAELSQYISFGVTAGPPPKFEIKLRQVETPPDVVPLLEFSPLLAKFYKEAGIADLWQRSQPDIDAYIALYHAPVTDAVQTVNAYLRQQTSGVTYSHFQIFIDLLEAPNHVQSRSYGNDYTVIVGPSTPPAGATKPEPRTFDVRHAYLHYSLEPLATHNKEVVLRKKPLGDHLGRAPAIGEAYRRDFLLLVSECLIKAVESRLDHTPGVVSQAFHEGYILTPYFAEQLPVYERQEESMTLYYPEMVGAIEMLKEEARLANIDFSGKPTERPAIRVAQADQPETTGAAKLLDDAETLLVAKPVDQAKLDKAKRLFLAALQETDQKPMHAKTWYGLARIAMLQNDPETAEDLFRKTLDLDPEPQDKAWTLYYLGRLAIASGDRGRGVQFIQQALDVPGASDMARKKASEALQQFSKP